MKYTWWALNGGGGWPGTFLLCDGGYIHDQKDAVHWGYVVENVISAKK